jgi:hypothetical protein
VSGKRLFRKTTVDRKLTPVAAVGGVIDEEARLTPFGGAFAPQPALQRITPLPRH